MNPRKNETGRRPTLNNTCQVYLGVVDRRAHGCPVKTQESMESLQGVSSKERCTDKTGLDLDSHRPLFDRLQYAIKTGLCEGLVTRTTGVLCADNRQRQTDTIEHSEFLKFHLQQTKGIHIHTSILGHSKLKSCCRGPTVRLIYAYG